ncbi:response regulator transcription factor [Paenibacillus harenae]|uniref:Two-component system response regulator YesN n=1 Tax=Paenibacillus harenae TaxID=306543 RepID=A0ABT9TZ85_PAEHA|nr:response regulator transcription factor [Paenibacillus harenae]MDQ0112696.1 two-component system response regulator YesN [Paenibacillus harenae]
MHKVLIVDDEPMIREGLKTIIEWDKHGFVVIGEASNGLDALDKYQALQPDLILIDIRMPGMDGLQFINEVRKNDTTTNFIILSGYADFEYAKKAIGFGVDGYILKPVDEDELETYVERIAGSLKRRGEQQVNSEQTLLLRREELLQKLAGGHLLEEVPADNEAQALLGMTAKYYQLMLIEVYSREHSLTRGDTFKKKLAELIEQKEMGFVFSAEPYIGVLLKDYLLQSGSREQMTGWLTELCGPNARFAAAVSEPVRDWRELQGWAQPVNDLLKSRFMLKGQQIHIATLSEETREVEDDLSQIVESFALQLYYMIDIGSVEGVEKALGEAEAKIAAMGGATEQMLKSSWASIVSIVLNKVATANPSLPIQEYLPMITALYLEHHYNEMLGKLQHKLSDLAQRVGRSDASSVMKQITDFIERHYYENLKLETLADLFNYNSGYLGKMFKSHTGQHFNTYLDQIRIQHAIELLQEGMKVHQVSERVGYANVDYFHSKFKKYKGVSPSTYKKI